MEKKMAMDEKTSKPIDELSQVFRESGIVGAGGAGFPAYAKLDKRADVIILNCAECEPLLKLHQQLLEKYAEEIVKTFYLIGCAVGAKEMIIGIKKAYKKTIDALNEVLSEYPGIRLGLLDEVYPAGDEVVLIYEVTGMVIRPGGLPIESGVAVFNVETVYNAFRALEGQPVTDKLVSVAGEVKRPVTLRVPVGTDIETVVQMAGGALIPEPVYFLGGPMMGSVGTGTQPVTKTTNAVLVLPKDHYLVQKKKSNSSIDIKRAAASCCNCSMCTDLCPRNLLGHPIEPHRFMQAAACKDVQNPHIFLNTNFCSSCGLCELYSCFQGLSPRTLITEYKNKLRAAGVKPPLAEAKPVGREREYRKVPMERLRARLDLNRYDQGAPLEDEVKAVNRVKLLFSQHIGAPAQPVVSVGETVVRGQVIAAPAAGLSVAVHASIDGVVKAVAGKYLIIDAR